VKDKPLAPTVVLTVAHPSDLDDDLPLVCADAMIDLVRDGLVPQSGAVPEDAEVAALTRVVVGYLRTSPLGNERSDFGRVQVATTFVTVLLDWWTSDPDAAAGLASELAEAFRRHRVEAPESSVLGLLGALGTGVLRQCRLENPPRPARTAVADWVVTLYLAGGDDWA